MTEQRTITEADLNRLALTAQDISLDGGSWPDIMRAALTSVGISVEVPIPEPEGDVLVAANGNLYHPGGPDGWQMYGLPHSTGLTWADVLGGDDAFTVYRAESDALTEPMTEWEREAMHRGCDALTEVPDEKVRMELRNRPWNGPATVVAALHSAGFLFCERKGGDGG